MKSIELNPKNCTKCKESIEFCMRFLDAEIVPIIVKTIIDDKHHFHKGG